jgi:hypothetical protein
LSLNSTVSTSEPAWHQGQAGIAAGAVDDGAGDAGVEEAVLLGQVGAEGQADLAMAGGQGAHFGADQAHHACRAKLPRTVASQSGLRGSKRFWAGRAVWGMFSPTGNAEWRMVVDVDVNVN